MDSGFPCDICVRRECASPAQPAAGCFIECDHYAPLLSVMKLCLAHRDERGSGPGPVYVWTGHLLSTPPPFTYARDGRAQLEAYFSEAEEWEEIYWLAEKAWSKSSPPQAVPQPGMKSRDGR